MLSLEHRLSRSVAMISGVSAYVMPIISPWYLLTMLPSVVIILIETKSITKLIMFGVVASLVFSVLLGYLSPTFVSSFLAASALIIIGNPVSAFVVLLPNLSFIGTLTSVLSEWLNIFQITESAPSLVSFLSLSLLVGRFSQVFFIIIGVLASLVISWGTGWITSDPSAALAIAGIPVLIVAAIIGSKEIDQSLPRIKLQIFLVYVLAISTWIVTSPKEDGEIWVLLPESEASYEAKYFSNYIDALRFSGIQAQKATSPSEIPHGSLVILPWLTESLPDEELFGTLAREREWTVIVGGEHTNMGNISNRINKMIGRKLLLDNLSVPPNNSDYSGYLRMPTLIPWPHDAIFNRGASVSPISFSDKVILQGDGWWVEPNIGEWLWLGDYQWQKGEKAGRLSLGVVSDVRGARWVVLGDNSILINRQLIADPRATKIILRLANLWPVFLHDLLLIVVAFGLVFVSPVVSVVLVVVSVISSFSYQPGQLWKDVYTGLSGFSEDNFNNVISDLPQLLNGRKIIRRTEYFDKVTELSTGKMIVFQLVNKSAEINGIKLNNCRRLGSLQTTEGPYLMDAQACRVYGESRILIGSPEAAVALSIEDGDKIIILDRAFLSNRAPNYNATWLLEQLQPAGVVK